MNRKAQLSLEVLSERIVPAAGPTSSFGISLDSLGTLHINGDDRQQDGSVWIADGELHASMYSTVWKKIAGQLVQLTVPLEKTFSPDVVKHIAFSGKGGNDSFINETSLPATLQGAAGDDHLVGGPGNDVLLGGIGDDILEGRDGDDMLNGLSGNDWYVFAPIRTGLGFDTINEFANSGEDTLDFSDMTTGVSISLGTSAVQEVVPNVLSIKLTSGLGIEDVRGSSHGDNIAGNSRANSIHGNGGDDTVSGNGGNDSVWGGAGNDELSGGAGNDRIWGDAGNDDLDGGSGNDFIYSGAGVDAVQDGVGNDYVNFSSATGGITIATQGGNDTVVGSNYNDTITGFSGYDKLDGGLGNDSISGGFGDDSINGGSGYDTLNGGDGKDQIRGGSGNDKLFGDAGKDNLDGEADDDSVDGGSGRDTLDGGDGTDKLFADRGDETLYNGEHVEITVPDGSPQTDGWSCGPNSGSRLLRSYGFNVSYEQLRSDAQDSNIISDNGLGTPPPDLRDIIKHYKTNTQLKSGAEFQDVIDRLSEGRPVITLIGWGTIYLPSPIPFYVDTAPQTLHYVCLTGFDLDKQEIYYMDTNGVSSTFTYSDFQEKWNWPGSGAAYGILAALGIRKDTMIW